MARAETGHAQPPPLAHAVRVAVDIDGLEVLQRGGHREEQLATPHSLMRAGPTIHPYSDDDRRVPAPDDPHDGESPDPGEASPRPRG
jgi:hypothetical protein